MYDIAKTHDIMVRFMVEKVGFNPETDLMPSQAEVIEKQFNSCVRFFQMAKQHKTNNNYYAFCSAYRNLQSFKSELRALIFDSSNDAAIHLYKTRYLNMVEVVAGLEWQLKPSEAGNDYSLGKSYYKSLHKTEGKNYQKRKKRVHSIAEVLPEVNA